MPGLGTAGDTGKQWLKAEVAGEAIQKFRNFPYVGGARPRKAVQRSGGQTHRRKSGRSRGHGIAPSPDSGALEAKHVDLFGFR